MSSNSRWITPFMKQGEGLHHLNHETTAMMGLGVITTLANYGLSFVTLGVTLNMMAHGSTVGYGAMLLAQLRQTREIVLDAEGESWIASIIGSSILLGALIVSVAMKKFGRKTINLTAALTITIAWVCFVTAKSITVLYVARLLQGLSMGFSSFLGAILIGECTSPKNRGAFLTTISLAMLVGILLGHTIGSYISWQKTALVFAIIGFIDIVIIVFSPESPSYLALQGKYDECRRVFHWLRGYDEEEELEKMIKTDILQKATKLENNKSESLSVKLKRKFEGLKSSFKEREFYVPIILVMHLNSINSWSGCSVLDNYTSDVYHIILGKDVDVAPWVMSADIQRVISNAIAIFLIKKVRRRVMLKVTISLNVLAYLLIAGYVYAKESNILPFDHISIGVLLIHILVFSLGIGSVPLPNIIIGEVFPLRYKEIGGMTAILMFSINYTICVKSAPYLITTIGLYGQYCVCAAVLAYCLIVSWIMLPETKDKTLLEIEETFRGKPILSDEKLAPLSSLQICDKERTSCNCSL